MKKILVVLMMVLCCAACANAEQKTEIEAQRLKPLPKVTILDTNSGNTSEYINKIITNNDLILYSAPITNKITRYVGLFKQGTFLIENEGQAALISIYNGRPIYGYSVLVKDEEVK